MNNLHRVFAAGVVQFDFNFLYKTLSAGVNPNGPFDLPLMPDGESPDFDPWSFLISFISHPDDEFKKERNEAWKTLEMLIVYGLDLTQVIPVKGSSSVNDLPETREQLLLRRYPKYKGRLDELKAAAEEMSLHLATANARGGVRPPPRL